MKQNNNKQNNRNRNSKIPDSNPSKAMDSKREVEQSKDPKTDQDFPGYPHYPAKEDIMDERSGEHRVDMNMENMASAHNATGVSQRFLTAQESQRNSFPQDQQANESAEDLNDDLAVSNSKDEADHRQNASNEALNSNVSKNVLDENTNEQSR